MPKNSNGPLMIASDRDIGRNYVDITADIVSAYVGNNAVSARDLPGLIASVHASVAGIAVRPAATEQERAKPPAVPVNKSVTPEYLICLENGRKLKSLKRHLRAAYNLTPEEYRAKWGLPSDYPMVAPNYSRSRSELAVGIGLGQRRTEARAKSAKPEGTKRAAPVRGRARKPV